MIIERLTVGPFQENCYLVVDEHTRRAALVDPGDEPDRIAAMVRKSGATLEAIWLTHGHIDHIGGIAGVRRHWPVPVHLHPLDLPLYERGTLQAAYYGIPFEQPDAPDHALNDGDVLRLGTLELRVMHTPGHAPGHVVLHGDRTVLGGDLLFAGSIGRTDLPLSDPLRMEESLERIMQLEDDAVVYPGHGPATTIGAERASNPFLNGVARVLKR
jgi:hydroxyacylglutathione hydrolase